MEISPGVWFIFSTLQACDYGNDRDRVLSAAQIFRKLSPCIQRDMEATGRMFGTALGILKAHELPRLNQEWEPDWLQPPHGETNQELDWSNFAGTVNQTQD